MAKTTNLFCAEWQKDIEWSWNFVYQTLFWQQYQFISVHSVTKHILKSNICLTCEKWLPWSLSAPWNACFYTWRHNSTPSFFPASNGKPTWWCFCPFQGLHPNAVRCSLVSLQLSGFYQILFTVCGFTQSFACLHWYQIVPCKCVVKLFGCVCCCYLIHCAVSIFCCACSVTRFFGCVCAVSQVFGFGVCSCPVIIWLFVLPNFVFVCVLNLFCFFGCVCSSQFLVTIVRSYPLVIWL